MDIKYVTLPPLIRNRLSSPLWIRVQSDEHCFWHEIGVWIIKLQFYLFPNCRLCFIDTRSTRIWMEFSYVLLWRVCSVLKAMAMRSEEGDWKPVLYHSFWKLYFFLQAETIHSVHYAYVSTNLSKNCFLIFSRVVSKCEKRESWISKYIFTTVWWL